MQTANEHEEQ